MPNREPRCRCGQVRIQCQSVCVACWKSADEGLRLRCKSADLGTRRSAFAQLYKHAIKRGQDAQQPTLFGAPGHVRYPLLYATAALITIPMLVFAVAYCTVWWDYRHLLFPRKHQPNAAPISAITDDVGASNHSPRAGALLRRDYFKEETSSCTNR